MKVTEIIKSIGGEHPIMGHPCAIIRLAGCNLNCAWCDNPKKYDQNFEMTPAEIVKQVQTSQTILVTGGEPLYRDLDELRELIQLLRSHLIILETNGTLYDREIFSQCIVVADIKSPSSCEESDVEMIFDHIDEIDYLKIVIKNQLDLGFFNMQADRFGERCVVLASLEDHTYANEIIAFMGRRPDLSIRVNMQIHKLLRLP